MWNIDTIRRGSCNLSRWGRDSKYLEQSDHQQRAYLVWSHMKGFPEENIFKLKPESE